MRVACLKLMSDCTPLGKFLTTFFLSFYLCDVIYFPFFFRHVKGTKGEEKVMMVSGIHDVFIKSIQFDQSYDET